MTLIEALAQLHRMCPEEFFNSRELWVLEDYLHMLYNQENCEIVDRTILPEEVKKIDD